ncbi:MAG TPA: tetratricopeptide repeat protein [Thermoanaerobaculia bacterium]|jgi:tetratricopeptide (TPR) repeat protein|nr:tetratricopeptide repeat protein [Thermoanaerobaculia bacterium]
MNAMPLLLALLVQTPCSGEGAFECWLSRGLESVAAEKLEDAEHAFRKAFELEPDRGEALNDLAQVLADLGRDAEAEPFFKQVVSLKDPLRPFYRRNYGDFLSARGRWEDAARQYRAALDERPADYQTHESLAALLSEHSPEALPEYLHFLLNRGQAVWAGEVALVRLQEEPTEEYLALLAEARAGQTIPPDQLFPPPVVEVLGKLNGEGARELLALGEGARDPSAFSWWAERPGPRKAFRSLARAFGDSRRQAGWKASAGDYYRLAVLLTPDEPDLVSFRRMLDLPSATDDPRALDRLALWNERVLGRSRPERSEVYRYRHDLGLHYAALGKWQECRCPTSGIYQLERAVHLADVAGPPDGDPPFDARIYIRLAELYLAAGRPDAAAQALQQLGQAYEDQGLQTESDILSISVPHDVSKGSEPGTLSPADILGDPPVPLRDFTTEPPRPPR